MKYKCSECNSKKFILQESGGEVLFDQNGSILNWIEPPENKNNFPIDSDHEFIIEINKCYCYECGNENIKIINNIHCTIGSSICSEWINGDRCKADLENRNPSKCYMKLFK